MDNVAILTAARGVIERGWIKHNRDDGMGRHCALGALDVVTANTARYTIADSDSEVVCYLVSALDGEKRKGSGYYCQLDRYIYPTVRNESIIADYNNHPDTTRKDMLAWFSRAIELAKEKEQKISVEDFLEGGKYFKADEAAPVLQDA